MPETVGASSVVGSVSSENAFAETGSDPELTTQTHSLLVLPTGWNWAVFLGHQLLVILPTLSIHICIATMRPLLAISCHLLHPRFLSGSHVRISRAVCHGSSANRSSGFVSSCCWAILLITLPCHSGELHQALRATVYSVHSKPQAMKKGNPARPKNALSSLPSVTFLFSICPTT